MANGKIILTALLAAALLLAPASALNDLQVTLAPVWIRSLSDQQMTITLTNLPTSRDSVNELRIPKPAIAETTLTCGAAPEGWNLASPFGSAICAYATDSNPIVPNSTFTIGLTATFGKGYPINLTLVAKDNGTESAQSTHLLAVGYDGEPPADITLASPAPGSWQRAGLGIYFDATASDDNSGIAECFVILSPVQDLGSLEHKKEDGSCRGIVMLPSSLAEGKHVLRLTERDAAGNPRSKDVEIRVDNTPPKIKSLYFSGAPGFVRPGSEFTLTVQLEDKGSGFAASTVGADLSKITGSPSDVDAKADGCDSQGCYWKRTASAGLSDGAQLAYAVFASDIAGSGIAYRDGAVAADSRKPEIRIITDIEPITTASSFQLNFAVSEAREGSGADRRATHALLDGADLGAICSGEGSLSCSAQVSAADGKHVLKISSADAVGNIADEAAAEFTVDTAAPAISRLSASFRLLSGGLVISADVSDATTDVKRAWVLVKTEGMPDRRIDLARNGDEWSSQIVAEPDLKREYSLEFSAEDSAGNGASESMGANLFQIFVVGALAHLFAAALLAVFLYWAYSRTIKKHKVVGHYRSYRPETLGEKLEKFWFDLTRRKRYQQKKLEEGKE